MDPFTANRVASLLGTPSYLVFVDLWPEWWIDSVEKQARWQLPLVWKWPRTMRDAKEYEYVRFIYAAQSGHLELLKWLHREFPHNAKEAKWEDCAAFIGAAEDGHLQVLKWLHRTFLYTSAEAKSRNCRAFQLAIWYGHLEVLKWLHQEFPHTTEEVFSNFYITPKIDGRVSNWIKETFGRV